MTKDKVELLSPAGSWEAMVAAVQCGADAVYLGCGGLNARRGAKNFTSEELPPAVAYCHLRGVKVYLTLNTLVLDKEFSQAEDELRRASRLGVDAVIVQDWGLAALARQIVPDLPLHASTQMSIHSLAGVEKAAEMGFRCAVLGRELDRDNVRHICAHSPIPIEVFVHGALCMCVSGQCAMSAVIGARSGNRGLCAQPCRMAYRLDGGKPGYPLSLKDLCLAPYLRELKDMGVKILKLEGRMRRPEYVAVVTSIYAALLREDRLPSRDELKQLTQAFSRDGFTDGYWRGEKGRTMFGMRREDAPVPEELFRKAREVYQPEAARTIPVSLSAVIRGGQSATLTAMDLDGHAVTVEGGVPEPARKRPLVSEEVKARLSKTGGTVFRVENVNLELEDGLSLPASAINALRRDALDGLSSLRTQPPVRREEDAAPAAQVDAPVKEMGFTVSLTRSFQLTEELLSFSPEVVYLPAERITEFDLGPFLERTEFCVSLPRVCKDNEMDVLRVLLRQARERGCRSAEIGNIGLIRLAREFGFALRGGPGLNVFNSRSLIALAQWGLTSAALSFELRWEQIRDIAKPMPCEVLAYGRLPLMITENCIADNAKGCEAKNLHGLYQNRHELTDRRGERFPLLPVFGCRTEIENSKHLFLTDKPELYRCGLRYARLRFTTETAGECAEVFHRCTKKTDWLPEDYTRGLFYRGVE